MEHTNGDHNELFRGFGEISGTVSGIDKKIDRLIASVDSKHASTEARIISIEKDISRAKGATAVLSVVLTVVVSFVKDLFVRR